jgi:hypothetical protein
VSLQKDAKDDNLPIEGMMVGVVIGAEKHLRYPDEDFPQKERPENVHTKTFSGKK